MPTVTVILPTHNRAALVGRAVTSVLVQTFEDFELLIVDDASNDDTEAVVHAIHDRRIRYIRHEVNQGEAGSRNTGLRNARGRYIAYLDDDDEWLPDKLKKQVAVMDGSRPEIGVVYTAMRGVELGTGKPLCTWKAVRKGRVLDHLLEINFLPGATALVRMECFRKVGPYNLSVQYGPDWEMWIRIAQYFDFEAIEEPLYNCSIHTNQLTADFTIQIAGIQKILELHSGLFSRHPKAYARHLVHLGLLHYLCSNTSESRRLLKEGIRRYPWQIRPYKLFLLSYLSKDSFGALLALRERATLNTPDERLRSVLSK